MKRAYLITLMIEGDNEQTDIKAIQEEITQRLMEDGVLDTADHGVTHVFDMQEMPPMCED